MKLHTKYQRPRFLLSDKKVFNLSLYVHVKKSEGLQNDNFDRGLLDGSNYNKGKRLD